MACTSPKAAIAVDRTACIPPRPLDDLPRKGRIRSPLHQAVIDGRLHHFRLLVEKLGADVNAKDIYGWTPLTVCCLIDDENVGLRCMKILTRKRVDLNQKDCLQRTPLHYCCIGGKQQLARYLVDGFEALDVHVRDCYGHTPLMYAAMRGRPGIVRLLTERYVSSSSPIDERDHGGRTALMLACACGNYASAYVLLTIGGAGKKRRDDAFFRSPAEWVYEAEAARDEEIRREMDPLVQLTVPLNAPVGFDRRLTRLLRLPKMAAMYDRTKPFVCHHRSRRSWRYSDCFNELVSGIPEMFTHFHVPPTGEEERLIDGQDSRRVLLAALEDPVPAPVRPCKFGELTPVHSTISVEPSHASMTGAGTASTRSSPQAPPTRCISTPRLIELRANPDRMMVPDLVTLFQMYVPRDPVEKRSLTRQDAPQNQNPVSSHPSLSQQTPLQVVPPIPNVPKMVFLAQYH